MDCCENIKKPTLNPTLAKNYRPFTVSSIVSKILELYIIDECSDFKGTHTVSKKLR